MKTGECRGCGATMIWAVTINGKKQPFDPQPIDGDPGKGDRVLMKRLVDDEGDMPLALSQSDLTDAIRLSAGRHRIAFYRPHHATCPEREQFKGPQTRPEPDPEGTPL